MKANWRTNFNLIKMWLHKTERMNEVKCSMGHSFQTMTTLNTKSNEAFVKWWSWTLPATEQPWETANESFHAFSLKSGHLTHNHIRTFEKKIKNNTVSSKNITSKLAKGVHSVQVLMISRCKCLQCAYELWALMRFQCWANNKNLCIA